MLDVIHYLIEEDIVGATELTDTRRRFRTILYPDLYGSPYVMADPERDRSAPMDDAHTITAANGESWEGVQVTPGMRGLEAPMDAGFDSALTPTPIASYGAPSGPQRRGRMGAGVAVRPTSSSELAHKPYIPPTDLSVSNNPYAPIRGLREAPMV